jgi:hypothetical protein
MTKINNKEGEFTVFVNNLPQKVKSWWSVLLLQAVEAFPVRTTGEMKINLTLIDKIGKWDKSKDSVLELTEEEFSSLKVVVSNQQFNPSKSALDLKQFFE